MIRKIEFKLLGSQILFLLFYFQYFKTNIYFLGAIEARTYVYYNPACLPRLLVDYKIFQFYFYPISFNGE